MNKIRQLFVYWLYCQTDLKKTTRWSKYVKSRKDGKSVRSNGIRRQNVAEHTLSKTVVFTMILPLLEKVFGNSVDFNLLTASIVNHDFGEGLRGDKYDVLAKDKTYLHDVEEYMLFMNFMKESDFYDRVVELAFERSFLLQFALTSYGSFPIEAQKIMEKIRSDPRTRNTAILFQIIEKWEYFFYAHEHRYKHPTISDDVYSSQFGVILKWIEEYPEQYHQPLKEIFMD